MYCHYNVVCTDVTEVCPDYLYPTCDMPEELFGRYYTFAGKHDSYLTVHQEGVLLGNGENSTCYMRQPGRGSHAPGSPGVMFSVVVIVRWDNPHIKYV